MTSSVSSKPCRGDQAGRAPSRVRIVLSTTVEPCMNSEVAASKLLERQTHRLAAERIESRTPSAKFGGVESDLPRWTGSPAANTIVSVQVPPTSRRDQIFASDRGHRASLQGENTLHCDNAFMSSERTSLLNLKTSSSF